MADTTTTSRNVAPPAHRPAGRYDPPPVEAKWRERWEQDELYKTEFDEARRKWYSLTMYPYPSGTLHVGHWFAFVGPDIFARYQRMNGYNVMFPMGFDAFGLPAENAAIKNNAHPAEWTFENIEMMKQQYRLMGAMIDWSREIITCAPEFYRWNQWLFLKMLERGLAYRAAGPVWWCPKDQTVLANEQVLDGNVCERCGTEVYKRDLEQWYFRITAYVEELLRELDNLDWPERVKIMQRNWIGRSEGARLNFTLDSGKTLDVFTTRPDTILGATFMVLAPEHPLVSEITTPEHKAAVDAYIEKTKRESEVERMATAESKEKTGVFTGSYALNPMTEERIPIWIADYVLMGYGTGAIMAVPAHDERDFLFARQFGLPIRVVIQPDGVDDLETSAMSEAYDGAGTLVNSGPLNGKRVPEELPDIISWLEAHGRGKAEVNYRLRDWLISRQRYWGTPIPIIYCDDCGMVPVPESDLPVELPLDAEFTPTGQSPLVTHEKFLNVPCPTCGNSARRETDTMDTFVDSSWYWFRYTSPHEDRLPFDPVTVKQWCPVDLYCGGIEHAILHLLYARFITKVCRDLGLVDHGEPYTRLLSQGMILGAEGTKMSKSRGTQVGPDELAAKHGSDALRLHLMYLGPWDQGGGWNARGISGMERFIRRFYQVVVDTPEAPQAVDVSENDRLSLRRLTHRTIQRVTNDLAGFQFNTMVAALIEFTNELVKLKDAPIAQTAEWREAVESLALMMAPSAPYVAEEFWERLGKPYSVHQQAWPQFDESLARLEVAEIVVQVNGKVRGRLTVSVDLPQEEAVSHAMALPRVSEHLNGRSPDRVIYVPGRLLNLVIRGS